MKQQPQVEIIIDEDGNVSLEVKGIRGKKCLDLTKKLEQELGNVQKRRHKSAFFQQEQNRLHQKGK